MKDNERMIPVGVSLPASVANLLQRIATETGCKKSEIALRILRPGLVKMADSLGVAHD